MKINQRRAATVAISFCALAGGAVAQETRDLDAHEHGVSTLQIAQEGGRVQIDLLSPGMDIVGFEHEASSTEDKEAVAAAIRQFLTPEEIVTLPDGAGCRLTEVLAHLHTGDHEDEHMHEGDDHAHNDDHAEGEEQDHDHEEHAEGEDQDHEEHAEGKDHDHEDHADEARHSAFHVTYGFACDDEDALTSVGFPFFERFPNAEEIEVQYVTETGAGTAELTPDAAEVSFE